jgi:hypothetical protein
MSEMKYYRAKVYNRKKEDETWVHACDDGGWNIGEITGEGKLIETVEDWEDDTQYDIEEITEEEYKEIVKQPYPKDEQFLSNFLTKEQMEVYEQMKQRIASDHDSDVQRFEPNGDAITEFEVTEADEMELTLEATYVTNIQYEEGSTKHRNHRSFSFLIDDLEDVVNKNKTIEDLLNDN